jgi:hypothetical protein
MLGVESHVDGMQGSGIASAERALTSSEAEVVAVREALVVLIIVLSLAETEVVCSSLAQAEAVWSRRAFEF